MGDNTSRNPPGARWRQLVGKPGSAEFTAAFAPDAVLEASVLDGPLVGPQEIAAFFVATTSGMYEALSFTAEVEAGSSLYLEWSGRAFGLDLSGVTIVTRDAVG